MTLSVPAFRKHCFFLFFVLIIITLLLSGCRDNSVYAKTLSNGYYAAEAENFDANGWKDFVSIYVTNGRIATVEYNAKNTSGFIKSWDPVYMRNMNASTNNYPNKYIRDYASALLRYQNPNLVDAVSGATYSYHNFILLSRAVIEQAQNGNKEIALVKLLPVKKLSAP